MSNAEPESIILRNYFSKLLRALDRPRTNEQIETAQPKRNELEKIFKDNREEVLEKARAIHPV